MGLVYCLPWFVLIYSIEFTSKRFGWQWELVFRSHLISSPLVWVTKAPSCKCFPTFPTLQPHSILSSRVSCTPAMLWWSIITANMNVAGLSTGLPLVLLGIVDELADLYQSRTHSTFSKLWQRFRSQRAFPSCCPKSGVFGGYARTGTGHY